MPDLLLELFSEEIPARMQARAAEDLRRLVTDGLVEAGLTYEGAKAFVTPRRLALTVHGLTARSADLREERKGPRVGAPAQALEGFLRAAGLASIDEAQVQSDPKKGDFYAAVITKPGRAAEDVIAELAPQVVREFPWPRSMRWGARSAPSGSLFGGPEAEGAAALRWVRPLRSILCTFGPETEEPSVVRFEIAGVASGDITYGHRFMAGRAPIRVRRFDDYVPALERAHVVLDRERRKAIIETEAKNLAFAQGLELVDDPGLVDEVAGLVEWPVVLMGRFDPAFLDIPDEVIRLTIRANQKCFVVRQPAPSPLVGEGWGGGTDKDSDPRASPLSISPPQGGRGSLTNRFVLTANIEASDGGDAIVAGNERVIAARLSDARFFWEQDKAVPLEDWAKKLGAVTFHEKLGSQADRVERIARLAGGIADALSSRPNFFGGQLLEGEDLRREQDYFRKNVERAARLAKADLTTGMVGEFPELQGVMGRYYFLAQHGLPSGPAGAANLPPEGRSSAAGGGVREGVDAEGVRKPGVSAGPPLGSPREAGATRLPLQGGDTSASAPVTEARFRAIADAIRDHYKPQGPGDAVPTDPVTVAVALADKLDTLVGFWAIDEKPTGSKDPFALRRAALGVIRILLTRRSRVPLLPFMQVNHQWRFSQEATRSFARQEALADELKALGTVGADDIGRAAQSGTEASVWIGRKLFPAYFTDLLAFFADRLKVHLRETGARHDLIDAVFAAGTATSSSPGTGEAESRQRPGEGGRSSSPAPPPSPGSSLRSDSSSPVPGEESGRAPGAANDDLLMIVRRVEALGAFLDSDDGANLLGGYRRAANILRAEEKKDGAGAFDGPPDHDLIEARGLPEERLLYDAMQIAEQRARESVEQEDFAAAMLALAELRPAVDAFFDKVTVNADDPAVRANRLKLLNQFRRATLTVANFSKIDG